MERVRRMNGEGGAGEGLETEERVRQKNGDQRGDRDL